MNKNRNQSVLSQDIEKALNRITSAKTKTQNALMKKYLVHLEEKYKTLQVKINKSNDVTSVQSELNNLNNQLSLYEKQIAKSKVREVPQQENAASENLRATIKIPSERTNIVIPQKPQLTSQVRQKQFQSSMPPARPARFFVTPDAANDASLRQNIITVYKLVSNHEAYWKSLGERDRLPIGVEQLITHFEKTKPRTQTISEFAISKTGQDLVKEWRTIQGIINDRLLKHPKDRKPELLQFYREVSEGKTASLQNRLSVIDSRPKIQPKR